MAVKKLSQITQAGRPIAATDFLVGVDSGNNDLLFPGTNQLTATQTFFVRTAPTIVTIPVASPAVVNWTGHGLSINDAVVLSLPLNRQAVTIDIATPGLCHATGHGYTTDDRVKFETTGALPTGLTPGTTYFVIAAGLTADAFEVSASQGGAAINTSGSQSGIHKVMRSTAMPTGIVDAGGVSNGGIFYVIAAGFGANSFEISTTVGGSALNCTVAATGPIQAQTGNDSNNGSAATRTGAFLTLQGVWNYLVSNIDLNGHQVTIQFANGVYEDTAGNATPTTNFNPITGIGKISGTNQNVLIQGDTTNQDNVVFSNQVNGNTFLSIIGDWLGGSLGFAYIRFDTGGFAPNINSSAANSGLVFEDGPVTFASSDNHAGSFLEPTGAGSTLVVTASVDLTGGGFAFFEAFGLSDSTFANTWNIYNAPNFSNEGFLFLERYAFVRWLNNTVNGTCTGLQATVEIYSHLVNDESATIPGSGIHLNYGATYTPRLTFGSPLANRTGINGAVVDTFYNYQTPATGFSITLGDTDGHLIINPAGTLATGTLVMCPGPFDGQIVNIRSSQVVTALTISPNSGQSVVGAPATIAVGQLLEAIYRAANTTWYFGT